MGEGSGGLHADEGVQRFVGEKSGESSESRRSPTKGGEHLSKIQ